MNTENISNKFKASFQDQFRDFDYTELTDLLTGYSLRGAYGDKLIKRLKIQDGKTYLPFFYFYLLRDKEGSEFSVVDGHYIPLVVKVDFLLKEGGLGGEEHSYGFDNKFVRNKKILPINVSTDNDFFFNYENGKVYQKKNNQYVETTLLKIYKLVLELHSAEYTSLVGFKARVKIILGRNLLNSLLVSTVFVAGLFYWIITGIFFKYDPILSRLDDKYNPVTTPPKVSEDESQIDFFGYKVRIWNITSYSMLALMLYLLTSGARVSLGVSAGIFHNSFLTLLFAIISIVIYDKLIPLFIRKLVVAVNEYKLTFTFKPIKLEL